eukprot:TRINITY_DN135473_c1_g1_i1.p1 TRINITY_DN135473_c1_g1~~TRINITY_DN135473_c1_g1_i1.p1  ORF type:complete len:406 (-),score=-17.86 TRINITY_DN135473_c1_g1_i1:627-1844(-)
MVLIWFEAYDTTFVLQEPVLYKHQWTDQEAPQQSARAIRTWSCLVQFNQGCLSFILQYTWHSQYIFFMTDHPELFKEEGAEEIKGATKEESKGLVIEIAIICDTSESMSSSFPGARHAMDDILVQTSTQFPHSTLRVACISYKDHVDGNDMLDYVDFTTDLAKVHKFIDTLHISGGGDGAEAVVDALDCILKLSWSENSARQIMHFADSGPHGKNFVNTSDDFLSGCPCGKDFKKLVSSIYEKGIGYTVVSYSPYTEYMARVFSLYHPLIECVAPPPNAINQKHSASILPLSSERGGSAQPLSAEGAGNPQAIMVFTAHTTLDMIGESSFAPPRKQMLISHRAVPFSRSLTRIPYDSFSGVPHRLPSLPDPRYTPQRPSFSPHNFLLLCFRENQQSTGNVLGGHG